VRKRNLYGEGRDLTPYGMRVTDNILPDLIDSLERAADYRQRREEISASNAAGPMLRRGLALTPVKFGISFTTTHLNQAGALVHLYTDGSIQLNHGGTEMGQGLYTTVSQVVAEELQADSNHARNTATQTAKGPNTSPRPAD